jgi:hypothetical protein
MFSLDDEMLDRVMAAASLLPQHARDSFLRSVAGRVAGLPNVGNAEIERAINFVLNCRGITSGYAFRPDNNKAAQVRREAERRFIRAK